MKLIAYTLMAVLIPLANSQKIGKKRIIDMTHPLSEAMFVWPTLPPINITVLHATQTEHYWIEDNMLYMPEHAGTHMDAPVHCSKGNLHIHEIPMDRFIGPGVIIRVADKAKENPDYQMTVDDLLAWESRNGPIPEGAILIMDSGWSDKVPDPYAMTGSMDPTDHSTFHFPSIHPDTARFIVQHRRQISIVGVDVLSLDTGSSLELPVHVILLGAGISCLENVAHLDQVPEAGAVIYTMPMNLYNGSGAAIRAFAIVNDDVLGPEVFPSSSCALVSRVSVMILTIALFYLL